jgi:hypothetical protein
MSKRKPFSVLRFASEALAFFRKQPALWPVTILLIAVPAFIMTTAGRLTQDGSPLLATGIPDFMEQNDPQGYTLVIATIFLTLMTIWGAASIMVVGRRMIGNRAGRARTSASSVMNESRPLVFPIFFTSIIQFAHALLWFIPAALAAFGAYMLGLSMHWNLDSTFKGNLYFVILPLIVLIAALPGIAYLIRSGFYSIALVSEDMRFTEALRRSKEVVSGRLWTTVRCLAGLLILFVLPPSLLSMFLERYTQSSLTALLSIDLATNIISAVFTAPLILASVLLYGALRDAPKSVRI